MTKQEAQKRYLQEPHFHALVKWMAGEVWSKAFTRDELTWATVLACDISLKREIENISRSAGGKNKYQREEGT